MRYTAPLLRSSSNLHQLHQAISLYLGASNDALPAAGYEALRDPMFPPLSMTLASCGASDIALWVCPADSRPDVVTNRWGSVVYPPGRYMRVARRRVRIDEFGPEYPLLADRGPFHIPVQSEDSLAGPTRFVVDPLTLPMQSGFYEGHNSVWIGGRVTSHSRNASNTRR